MIESNYFSESSFVLCVVEAEYADIDTANSFFKNDEVQRKYPDLEFSGEWDSLTLKQKKKVLYILYCTPRT